MIVEPKHLNLHKTNANIVDTRTIIFCGACSVQQTDKFQWQSCSQKADCCLLTEAYQFPVIKVLLHIFNDPFKYVLSLLFIKRPMKLFETLTVCPVEVTRFIDKDKYRKTTMQQDTSSKWRGAERSL